MPITLKFLWREAKHIHTHWNWWNRASSMCNPCVLCCCLIHTSTHTEGEVYVNKCWGNRHYLKRPTITHIKVISLTHFISYYIHAHTPSSLQQRHSQLCHIKHRDCMSLQRLLFLSFLASTPPHLRLPPKLVLKPHVTFDLTRQTLKQ